MTSAANAVGGAKRGPRKGGVDKEQILAAAREEFALHDYKGTTMRSVARRAGCDAKLIHYYFGSKDELFAEAIICDVKKFALRSRRHLLAVRW